MTACYTVDSSPLEMSCSCLSLRFRPRRITGSLAKESKLDLNHLRCFRNLALRQQNQVAALIIVRCDPDRCIGLRFVDLRCFSPGFAPEYVTLGLIGLSCVHLRHVGQTINPLLIVAPSYNSILQFCLLLLCSVITSGKCVDMFSEFLKTTILPTLPTMITGFCAHIVQRERVKPIANSFYLTVLTSFCLSPVDRCKTGVVRLKIGRWFQEKLVNNILAPLQHFSFQILRKCDALGC